MRNGPSQACVTWQGLHQRTECSSRSGVRAVDRSPLTVGSSDDVALVAGERGQRLEHGHAGFP